MKTKIRLSVRTLVEFVLRSGDLTSTFSGRSRAVEGTKAHQKVQKAQPAHYRPEVPLSHTIEAVDFVIEIGGRADGIIEQDDVTVIDEIKSTDTALDAIHEDDNPLFWAQAKCYAYIYALQQSLEKIAVQLTYYQVEDKTCLRFVQCYAISDLTAFFSDLIDRYLDWARLIQQGQADRNQSIKELKFPFDSFRAGQRELAVAVYRTVTAGNKLFAQAPTGIGKTLASLFPAVKAIGEGKTEKIFYLTAKTSTREIAEQALATLREKGLVLKSLTLTAKDKICFNAETDCDPEKCIYACGHYDRIHAALREIYAQPVFTRIIIEECAKKYQICPFEFSLDLALWADCVICDYNYVFDPRVSLKRLFAEDAGSHCLLIDEAHNLVDRAREMYSATLSKKPISELKQALKQSQPKLAKGLAPVQTCLARWGKACEQMEAKLLVQKSCQRTYYRRFINLSSLLMLGSLAMSLLPLENNFCKSTSIFMRFYALRKSMKVTISFMWRKKLAAM
ncbi:MAG: putative repair helicase [Anaerosporomusa subterranea]|jgi:DNA excision repair protein ERCC-2|nr:putative repair helicase [Anaerosporomusa subterranea]